MCRQRTSGSEGRIAKHLISQKKFSSYIIYSPSPSNLCFESGALLSELLNAFEMCLLFRVQTLILFWI